MNIQLEALQDSHNNHPIQTANNRSPIQMLSECWHWRDDELPPPDVQPASAHTIALELQIKRADVPLTDSLYSMLKEEGNPLSDDGNDRKNLYMTARAFLRRVSIQS